MSEDKPRFAPRQPVGTDNPLAVEPDKLNAGIVRSADAIVRAAQDDGIPNGQRQSIYGLMSILKKLRFVSVIPA